MYAPKLRFKNCESDKGADELDTENLRVPTATDTLSLLRRARRYSETNSEGDMFDHTDKLEQFVENKLVQNVCKTKYRLF